MNTIRTCFRRTALAGVSLLALVGGAAADVPAVTLTQRIPDPAGVAAGMPPQPLVVDQPKPTGSLGFSIGARYSCGGQPTLRRQLFVTVADTMQSLDVSKVPSPLALRMEVPWTQLAWLDGAAACEERARRAPEATDPDGVRYFLLRDRALAFATLTCTGKQGTVMTNASTPLDVWLRCPAESAAPASTQTEAPAAGDGGDPFVSPAPASGADGETPP